MIVGTMSTIDEVRDRIDIIDVVGQHVQLKKAGRTFKGICPFHGEKTPSFVVFPDSGNWRCFGACATGGDAFDFVMRIEGLDFKGALERLAQRVGVDLEPPSPQRTAEVERRDRLRDAVAQAAAFYNRLLAEADDAGARGARDYLARRAFDGAVVDAFKLGWAPDAWQVLADHLRGRGFTDDELLSAGLARPRDSGGIYDAFRGRLMIPIANVRGDVVGFGARTLDPEGVPKYLNSPQTDLFDKGRTLFGLDKARDAIRASGEAVVVEGYTDVIRAHAAGFRNVVASLGTALTDHHIVLLKRYAPRVILALDADAAGEAATLRGLEVAKDAATGDAVPVPTARGVMRFEHRLEVELRVATLPAGQDPDDVIRADPAAWRAVVAGAVPVMEHLFRVLTADLDLDDPGGKMAAVDRLMPVIAGFNDGVARAAWVARLADLVRMDERTLAGRLARGGRPAARRTAPVPPRAGGAAPNGAPPAEPLGAAPAARDPAGRLLGHLLLSPRRVDDVDAMLAAVGLEPLSAGDLEQPAERDLLEAIRYGSLGAVPPDAPPQHNLAALPPAHHALAAALRAMAAAEWAIDERTRARMLRDMVLRLRAAQCQRALAGLRHLEAEADHPEREDYIRQAIVLNRRLNAVMNVLSTTSSRPMGKRDRGLA